MVLLNPNPTPGDLLPLCHLGARDFWLGAEGILKIKLYSEKIKHI
jgi:hypothetical protein